jgi:predicted phosphoribosyltransferase
VEFSFRDRTAAGAALAEALAGYARRPDAVVLGLVRGGIPVAAAVAVRLALPLDALVIRKLGVPWSPEVAFGALGPGGVLVRNEEVAARLDQRDADAVLDRESAELARREAIYRGGRPPLALRGTVAVLVDDGLATGASARAAVGVARVLDAARIVLAVPVGSSRALKALRPLVDELVCPLRPAAFGAVSEFYDDFHQVTDAEVAEALDSASVRRPGTV